LARIALATVANALDVHLHNRFKNSTQVLDARRLCFQKMFDNQLPRRRERIRPDIGEALRGAEIDRASAFAQS
jgi:hypothetical protein